MPDISHTDGQTTATHMPREALYLSVVPEWDLAATGNLPDTAVSASLLVEAGKGRGTLGEKLFGSLVLFQACYTATPVCNRDLHSSARNLCTKQRRAKHDAGSTRILGILWSKCKSLQRVEFTDRRHTEHLGCEVKHHSGFCKTVNPS